MKPSKLSQACLLDVSGELGTEASGLLREHVETYPDGMLEYDQALLKFKQLNSLPPLQSQMDQVALERMKQQVKSAVHDAVGQQQKAVRWNSMRRWFYRSMSIASGIAAALVIMAGVYIVRQHIQAHQARVMDAENAQSGAGSAGIMHLFNALHKIPVPGAEDGLPQTDNVQ